MEYYVNVEEMLVRGSKNHPDKFADARVEVRSVIEMMGLPGDTPVETPEQVADVMFPFMSEHMIKVFGGMSNLSGATVSFGELMDDSGEIVYTDVKATVLGFAKDAQGYTVYVTGLGNITILP